MKKIYFSITFPDAQIVDESWLEKELRRAVEEIAPNAVVQQSIPDEESYENTVKQEIEDRKEAKSRSDVDIKEFSEEVNRRVTKFSDEDLPEGSRYMPREFRQKAKEAIITEQLAKERGVS